MKRSTLLPALIAVIGLSISSAGSATSAPQYPPTVGACSKQTFSNITINTPNISSGKVKLTSKKPRTVTISVNKASSVILSGVKSGKKANISFVLPSGKKVELSPAIVSAGGLVCPTNFIFKKAGTYRVDFEVGTTKRPVIFVVKK